MRVQGGILSILGTVLLWAPFIGLAVFAIHGAVTRHPLPLLACVYVLFAFRLVACLGGLFLSLGARRAHLLYRTIVWTTLALFLFSVAFIVFSGQYVTAIEFEKESRIVVCLLSGSFGLTLIGMFALSALSVLLLIRLYGQQARYIEDSAV